jgi:hypothetical protein
MGVVPGDPECGVAVGTPLRLGCIGVEWPVHVEEQQRSVHGFPRFYSLWTASISVAVGMPRHEAGLSDDHGVASVITASEPSWITPFAGLSPRCFGKLLSALRRDGADVIHRGRPWSLPLEDRVLLVTAYWRTNLTLRQLAPLFGVSKSTAGRVINHLGPLLALQPRKRFAKDTVLIVDGTLVPTRDHTIAERSKNYRYSTNHQVVIDADTRPVVVVGRPLAGNRNDCKAWEESGAKAAVGKTLTIADGGYPGTGLVIPHRRQRGQSQLPDWKEEHNKSHKQVRARVEHVFARMKTWKILRDCRLKGDGVHHAMLGIARMHNLALAG